MDIFCIYIVEFTSASTRNPYPKETETRKEKGERRKEKKDKYQERYSDIYILRKFFLPSPKGTTISERDQQETKGQKKEKEN